MWGQWCWEKHPHRGEAHLLYILTCTVSLEILIEQVIKRTHREIMFDVGIRGGGGIEARFQVWEKV